MLSKETLEKLELVRNIELSAKPAPTDFLSFLDDIMNDEDLGDEYEAFMNREDETQRQNRAECVIRQLKDFYKARNWQVYEQESGVELIIRRYADAWYTEVWTDPDSGLIHLRIQIPVIIRGDEKVSHMARVLHDFNQDYETGPGFFALSEATGRMDYIWRQDFTDGIFTEERFHRTLTWCLKTARKYYSTILILAD